MLEKVHLIDPDALSNASYNEQWQAVLALDRHLRPWVSSTVTAG